MEPLLRRLRRLPLQALAVPLLVAFSCCVCAQFSGMPLGRLLYNLEHQFFRNVFLVLALILPVAAGLGLNFAIVVGAMAGQIAILAAEDRGWSGWGGLAGAAILAALLGTLGGTCTGALMNRARGREMISGLIFGYFSSGVYQLLLLILAGSLLPFRSARLLLPQGVGLRSTIDLNFMASVIPGRVGYLSLLALFCAALIWLFRTRLGQSLRAVGQSPRIAQTAGIPVERMRLLAMALSTVLGAVGQVIYLQDFTTINTYTQHDQVGFYAIAALLVGGATVRTAGVLNAVLGTALFHLLLLTLVPAMARLVENSQIEEYCREFIVYLIIGISLITHAWKGRRG